jgi:hypothetical protein
MQWNFHTPKNIPMAMRTDQQYYFTGPTKTNERFTNQGRAYLIQVTNPVNFNGEAISSDIEAGSLYFDWVCQFNIPQLNPAGLITNLALSEQLEFKYNILSGAQTFTDLDYIADSVGPVLLPNTQYIASMEFRTNTGASSPGTYRMYPEQRINDAPVEEAIATFDVFTGAAVYSILGSSYTITTDRDGVPEQVARIFWNDTFDSLHVLTVLLRPLTNTTPKYAVPASLLGRPMIKTLAAKPVSVPKVLEEDVLKANFTAPDWTADNGDCEMTS